MLAAIVPLLLTVAKAAAENLITNDGILKYVSLGHDVIAGATEVELRLRDVVNDFEEKIAAAKARGEVYEPSDADIAAVRARIAARTEQWNA